jgi:hypothetical protein
MDIFDPSLKQYRTLHTESVLLRVAPAAAGASTAEPIAQNLLGAGGVRPIRLRLGSSRIGPPPWTRPWFWPLIAFPPFGLALLLGIGGLWRRLQIDPEAKRVKLARSAARKRLRGAQALLARGEPAAFYAEVSRAITGYLGDKQHIVAAGLTREELTAALHERGHPDETVRKVLRVLDDCDRARFAPGSGEAPAREAMLGRADQLIGELEDRP